MLKGVNLQVIEINNPAGEYFERILYIVKPEFSATSRNKLLREAERMGKSDEGCPPASSRRRLKLRKALAILLAALAGAGIAVGICLSIFR